MARGRPRAACSSVAEVIRYVLQLTFLRATSHTGVLGQSVAAFDHLSLELGTED